MTRFSTISAIFLAGSFATLLVILHTPSQPMKSEFDESQFNVTTQKMVVSYCSFKRTLTATLELLAQGKTSLEEARNRVYESALHYHPGYLEHIAKCERGTTPQERVARNLIGHVRSLEERNPTIYVRVSALEIEFADMQRRVNAGMPQS
jgi:hypothetical protein